MRTKTTTVICVALIAVAIGASSVWAAKRKSALKTPLTAVGETLEARYAKQLKAIATEITQAVPELADEEKAAYMKARKAETAAYAEVKAARQRLDKARTATALVDQAWEWIGAAEKNIALAQEKLDKATTKTEHDAAQNELIRWQQHRDAVVRSLETRQEAAVKAKREEPKLVGELELAQEALARMQAIDSLDLGPFLSNDKLDAQLARYVVLYEATPSGLAEFAQQGEPQEQLVERLLADEDLMLQMVVADGANDGRYGRAMDIYTAIQKASTKAADGVLQRLALAISLEHAVPIGQSNPKAATVAPATVDPVKRYLHYEKAYLGGELDPGFERLTAWDLRFVVDGNEPDETLVWGREMLRNYRPDHIYTSDYGWRYVSIVKTDVRYGSGNVKYDRPELQNYQNILMNGGICGRRAFIGRFILRAFGIPTTARPSTGHGALAHWTPDGWVVCLGGGWGTGWASGPYNRGGGRKPDLDFLAITQARANRKAFLKVKRAQWVGDLMGEKRIFGLIEGDPAFWNGVALYTQRKIIEDARAKTLAAVGEDLGEANEPTIAEKVMASPVTPEDRKITYGPGGAISIPAAAYSKPSGNTPEVVAMKSFSGGLQIFLPRFFPQGLTILRGGAWRGGADACRSGWRMPSSGYGRYNNWGFRAAMNASGTKTPREVKLDLGDGVTMEFVYIKPGTFIMGGSNTEDSKWHGVEVPKHEVTITKGYYLGKCEVTQAQFQKIMGSNPSTASKDPNAPADNISAGDAVAFCNKLAEKTGKQTRLPTEAEWEYACRAGTTTKYFFGDDPSGLGEYAWFEDNDGGKSHPVGQKKPNPWGLYDICGNVVERVSDKYAKDYYAKSPKVDPTGPIQGAKSCFEYTITAERSGKYTLTARVVTNQYDQRLNVTVGDADSEIVMEMPFTVGNWQDSKPVTLTLEEGENVLRFSRNNPPQYGLAIKSFTLKPVR